jgi:DNA (cytosine-5)-methyltransferase 1
MAGLGTDERGAGWNYYNENDRFAAQWLRELIKDGLIGAGDVDERSIIDVSASDLAGYTQHHFFAGIGGWSYALRLAGWPDDRPVWTGSCPCQPFSSAGQQRGHADERHLWPSFHALIAECKPPTVFGEQVASKLGREWFSAVRADLEAVGYACGAADLCAASVNAPHIRQRLWWLADADVTAKRRKQSAHGVFDRKAGAAVRQEVHGGLGNAESTRLEGLAWNVGEERVSNSWASSKLINCADGKSRPIEPSIQPLVDGFPNRVGVLRGAGNAIVPQVAAAFIEASLP